MANSYRNAAGQNPEDVYDPDVIGDGPTAAIGGIGYRDSSGVLLKFAARAYGSAAPNHGYRLSDGRDFSALWAKKGTASYNDSIVIPFGTYSATSTDSHDAGSTITFTISPDGTWGIIMQALHEPSGTSGSPLSGNWHKAPAAGVGASYEMQTTAYFTIQNNFTGDNPSPSYTATTGWLSLSSARQLIADTGHLLGGGVGVGRVDVSGYWAISIRKIGGTQVKASTLQCNAEALI